MNHFKLGWLDKAHLVFVCVVKQEHGSLSPGDVLAVHDEHGRGVGGDEEGEVGPQLGVHDPVVRRQVGGARQHGELRGRLTYRGLIKKFRSNCR